MTLAANRQLYILNALNNHEFLTKNDLSTHFHVSARTIQRDISELNQFFDDTKSQQEISYNTQLKTFEMTQQTDGGQLSDAQILIIMKVLFASRALNNRELQDITAALQNQVSPSHRQVVSRITNKEKYNYVPLHHDKDLVKLIWDLSNEILAGRRIKIQYRNRNLKNWTDVELQPKSIFFSEYYFYLIAAGSYHNRDRFYRLDRIINYEELADYHPDGHRHDYAEGELRKEKPFMYNGAVEKVTFEYWGIEEAALDRLPTAKVIARHPQQKSITIEVNAADTGLRFWLLSQGNMVHVLSPEKMVTDLKNIVAQMSQLYQGTLGQPTGPQPTLIN
ncbi:helix-turn-helix transcriptional regulator [Lapidilactobacillus wuchangensis]|uniref:helix-turn-helix transcriptional regulator n=1 Tax=Lapidilactobacillus wuchangensis TaxID=2486001 RepID=UPI000F76B2A9|nr:WYL domain-containing protein [Lapidilactobacillus wuchangensis]